VGNDYYRKGVDILAAACGIVSNKIPRVKFYVVGANSDNLEVPSHPNLIFTGPIKDKGDLMNLFRKATVFCLPARFDRSPHVLAEAMSACKPIVATNVGGIRDAVIHSKTGLFVERENKDDLARALLLLLEHPELAREMGRAGKKRMLENFTWDIVAKRIAEHIQGTIALS
jgi:glycosyltransferase involved in cell wall biosynthesis